MKTGIKLLIIILSMCLCINLYSQNSKKLDSLFTVIKNTKTDTALVKAYADLCSEFSNSNPDTALYFGNLGLNLAIKAKYKKGMSVCYTNVGYILEDQGNYSQAKEYYLKSLQICEKLGDKKGMSKCYGNIGNINYYLGNFDIAIKYYCKVIKLFEELGDKKGMSSGCLNIGSVYANQGNFDKAIKYYLKSLKINEELGDKKGISSCYICIGNIDFNLGSYDKAIDYYQKSLKIDEELGDKNKVTACYNNIGNVQENLGKYDKAIECFLKSLKICEELGDKKGISTGYTNIGNIHLYQKNFNKAIGYYFKSLKIDEALGDKQGISKCYSNIGIVYKSQSNSFSDSKIIEEKFNKAMEYFLKSLKIAEELGNKQGMSYCYIYIGILEYDRGNLASDPKIKEEKYNKAIKYYVEALKISEELGDKNGIVAIYVNIATIQITFADSFADNRTGSREIFLKLAVEYGNKAINMAKEIKAIPREKEAANILMVAYKKLGNFKKSQEYAEIYITTNDSMFKEEKTKALADMEGKYQNEKKQREIELLNKNKELQQTEIRRQTTQKYAFIGGFVLMLVLSFVSYRSFRQKKKANRLLTEKNERIEAQKTEIEAQRNLAAEQRDLITEQKKDITDSINSAFRIQSALIPQEEYISSFLSNYFILYKPRDIVSGDFYWIDKKGTKLIIIAADCTGHGVPGAFMSMLGVAFLNEIVNKENITSPADILNKLRDILIKSLKQSGKLGESKEGMDIAALTIDLKPGNLNLQFAGANNPLYIVSGSEIKSDETFNKLTEIKGHKMPVGIHQIIEPFTNYESTIHSGDTLYIFSDGYMDQFGGPKERKFMYKQFKELLLQHQEKPMKEQKEILERTFNEWKGNQEQTDDVLVMGIKIS